MWLDSYAHQSLGLHGAPDALRVLAVASDADAGIELELLWQLCASLQQQGWPVVVLDASARESAAAPGLAQLLDPGSWPAQNAIAARTPTDDALAVLPAAFGLQRLAQQAEHGADAALERLQALFRGYAALMLYAPVQHLAPLLAGSGARALIVTGPAAHGMVRGFLQIKHLALHGVRSSVAGILPPGSGARRAHTERALQALRHSAARLLGQDLHTTLVDAARAPEIARLALQLLENACTIEAPCAWSTIAPRQAPSPLPMDWSRSN